MAALGRTPRRGTPSLISSTPPRLAQNAPGSGDSPHEKQAGKQGQKSSTVQRLIEQQTKLQVSNDRIERALMELRETVAVNQLEAADNDKGSLKRKLPRQLSGLVHEVYKELSLDVDSQTWDLTVCFDHSVNQAVNSAMLKNIQGLQTEETTYSVVVIRRAMRTYFKTLKNRAQREKTNKQEDTRIKQRRRQRKINKALARKKALKNTTSLSADVKAQLEPLLTAAYMSSDESVISSDSASEDEIENTTLPPPTKRKKLIKHHANWRSAEFQDYIESLDRKIDRRRTDRGKMMVLPIDYVKDSDQSAPIDCPDWAKSIFD